MLSCNISNYLIKRQSERYIIIAIKECLNKVEKYLHKITTVSQKMIELSTDENEIKTITLKLAEQEFRIIQIKKSSKNYKKENLDLSPKNSEILSATSKSGFSKKETRNAENDIKCETDIKSNSNYSSTSASNTRFLIYKSPNSHHIISKH